jgi:hypothetical protein
MSAWSASSALALLVAAGCGGGDDGGGGGGSTLSIDKLPGQLSGVLCRQSFKCCTAEALKDHTMSDCVQNTTFFLTAAMSGIRASETKGRAHYLPDKAAECTNALAAMTCDQWKKGQDAIEPPACAQFVQGLVDDGKACGQDGDCKSGYCEGDEPSSDTKPGKDGVCKAVAAAGGACLSSEGNEGCVKGTFCDGGKCTAARADGASCFIDDRECAGGYCADGKCSAVAPAGVCYAGCAFGGFAGRGAGAGGVLLLAVAGLAVARRRRRR